MIVLAVLVAATRSRLVEGLADASIPRTTAQNIVADLTYFLRALLRTTAVLGLIVVLLAWLTERSAAARSLRRGTSNAAALSGAGCRLRASRQAWNAGWADTRLGSRVAFSWSAS